MILERCASPHESRTSMPEVLEGKRKRGPKHPSRRQRSPRMLIGGVCRCETVSAVSIMNGLPHSAHHQVYASFCVRTGDMPSSVNASQAAHPSTNAPKLSLGGGRRPSLAVASRSFISQPSPVQRLPFHSNCRRLLLNTCNTQVCSLFSSFRFSGTASRSDRRSPLAQHEPSRQLHDKL